MKQSDQSVALPFLSCILWGEKRTKNCQSELTDNVPRNSDFEPYQVMLRLPPDRSEVTRTVILYKFRVTSEKKIMKARLRLTNRKEIIRQFDT